MTCVCHGYDLKNIGLRKSFLVVVGCVHIRVFVKNAVEIIIK